METRKFLEAKKQYDTIKACSCVLADNKLYDILKSRTSPELTGQHILQLVLLNDEITNSFLRWVETEKLRAEVELEKI